MGVTYTVTFDVVNEKGKKIKSCKVKVYLNDKPDRNIYMSKFVFDGYSSASYNEFRLPYARTQIRITYKDQYTGNNEQFYVYGIEKNVD